MAQLGDGRSTQADGKPYWRFMAMIGTGTVVMFALMYLNTYAADHLFWSETRFWMALIMGAAMMVVMLTFMTDMYRSPGRNLIVLAAAALTFGAALWLVRSQSTITDTEYMSAMIPHHSIAIMTSERAQISDRRVRRLADEIAATQRKEIAEMRALIADIDAKGVQR